VDVEGVERVANLVGHACRQEGERREPFALDGFLGAAPGLGDIAQDDGIPGDLFSLDAAFLAFGSPLSGTT